MAQDANGSIGGLMIIWNPREVCIEDWVSLPKILSSKFQIIRSKE